MEAQSLQQAEELLLAEIIVKGMDGTSTRTLLNVCCVTHLYVLNIVQQVTSVAPGT
jgi:hypothetical protein